MAILVTGATGLLGNNVVRHLLDKGESVRVMVRRGSDPRPLKGLCVDFLEGDVCQQQQVEKACEGVEAIIHSAAYITIGSTGLDKMRAVNVDGTKNVARAAQAENIRMVYVSSVDTLSAAAPGEPADEDCRGEKVACTYVVSKREAEASIYKEIEQGLDAVVVHPGFMLGPWDWKPSSGRMLIEIATRFAPFSPSGGMSVCDARDVAAGIHAALKQGKTGRNYILAGQNMTYFDAWKLFAQAGGRKGPKMNLGWLGRTLAGGIGDLITKITGREPDINSAALKLTSQFHFYSSDRAKSELGYETRPIDETVADAWNWFKEHNYA